MSTGESQLCFIYTVLKGLSARNILKIQLRLCCITLRDQSSRDSPCKIACRICVDRKPVLYEQLHRPSYL